MFYIYLVIVACFIFIYSLLAGKVDKLPISGPIIALLFGLAIGPLFLGVFHFSLDNEVFKVMAELALALVLFTDASKTNLRDFEHNIGLPSRLLLIGLPLTIIAGSVAGYFIFKDFSWIELGILATILAPTDAALGKPVVNSPIVPSKIKEALNIESGLNDGISVPILLLFIAFSEVSADKISFQYALGLFAQQIGIGAAAGLGFTFIADHLIRYSQRKNWITESWKPIIMIALIISCFAVAQSLGGSGFIATFSGGLLFGKIQKTNKTELVSAAEGMGDTISLITWLFFGAFVIKLILSHLSWEIVFYSVLSLTLIRMLPVFLSLINSGITSKQKVFIGWFGPRGLASIVFLVMILDVGLPHLPTLVTTIVSTIVLSVVLHGLTALPFSKMLKKENQ